jgi:endonuclease YncB( thermonuclease family)
MMLMMAAALAPFPCHVVRVHDGDGPIWCANGIKVRTAGVQAPDFENASPCRTHKASYVCDNRKAEASRISVERLVLGRTMSCQPVDRSYKRVVARCTLPDGRSLTCATLAAGAAQRWDTYWRRYKLQPCR